MKNFWIKLKQLGILISVYVVEAMLFYAWSHDEDSAFFFGIFSTVLTIYIWKCLDVSWLKK